MRTSSGTEPIAERDRYRTRLEVAEERLDAQSALLDLQRTKHTILQASHDQLVHASAGYAKIRQSYLDDFRRDLLHDLSSQKTTAIDGCKAVRNR